jgi:hypothetical protein
MKKTLSICMCALAPLAAHAGGSLNDPLEGTGVANNPNSDYVELFSGICTQTQPANPKSVNGTLARVFYASLGGQGDEGFSVAFGTTFGCDPSDPSVGQSQEEVDSDPLPPEQ